MIASLAAFAVLALVTPYATRLLGRRVFAVIALLPAAVFVLLLTWLPGVLAGTPVVETVPWIPTLDIALSFRLDALALLLALIVTGIGALVLLYCTRYFSDDEPALGRFAALLLAFAGVMFGLVTADDVFILFTFWEATSVLSYLLIGHYTGRKESRGAALQALTVTTFGGLAMLVGLVILSVAGGTTSLAELIANPVTGAAGEWAIALILVGAISKSALVPFHFWLPAAMAAPTPVSAYLHAAAMVKAGVYLVARLAPGYAELEVWHPIVIGLGAFTMLVGGWRALRQYDLKLLLAYGTVSQLGFLVMVTGFGTRDAALAGVALLLAHALFKAALFLVVGIVDHAAGTRDWRKLSGLGRRMPVVATIAFVAAGSMAGVPPLLGFVAKEAVFTAFLDAVVAGEPWAWVALVGAFAGSVLTVAYSARFLWGAFFTRADVPPTPLHREGALIATAPALLVGGERRVRVHGAVHRTAAGRVRRHPARIAGVPPRALARARTRPRPVGRGVRAGGAARLGAPTRLPHAGRDAADPRRGTRVPRHRLGGRPRRRGPDDGDPAPWAARLPRDHRDRVHRRPRRRNRHEHRRGPTASGSGTTRPSRSSHSSWASRRIAAATVRQRMTRCSS